MAAGVGYLFGVSCDASLPPAPKRNHFGARMLKVVSGVTSLGTSLPTSRTYLSVPSNLQSCWTRESIGRQERPP